MNDDIEKWMEFLRNRGFVLAEGDGRSDFDMEKFEKDYERFLDGQRD